MAGISDPRKQIDVAEIYDAFTYQESMWIEGLGLCGPGEGGELAASGATAREGKLPVNPSGGLRGAHPAIAGGMIRMVEAVRQVRGEAGDMQVSRDVDIALAHGVNGVCGQSHCVWILGRNPN
jgi:acetyl-CoA C-acetyltransferase